MRPVHPPRIRRRFKTQLSGHLASAVELSELRDGRLATEVVVVSAGAVGLDIAQRISPGATERQYAALHLNHHPRVCLTDHLAYQQLRHLDYVHSEEQGREAGDAGSERRKRGGVLSRACSGGAATARSGAVRGQVSEDATVAIQAR